MKATYFTRESGLQQSYEDYVNIYGEESARYLWETLHKNVVDNNKDIVFIDIPELSHLGFFEKAKEWAEINNKNFIYRQGSISLIRKLLIGEWNREEFLIVKPGEKIDPVYDWDKIIQSAP